MVNLTLESNVEKIRNEIFNARKNKINSLSISFESSSDLDFKSLIKSISDKNTSIRVNTFGKIIHLHIYLNE